MAVTESKLIRDFVGAIKDGTKEKTKAYETPATVTRIEDGTAWVHVPGGVEETPVQLTINATEGDTVRVRVANGRATIVGNVTNPPTDDATAKEALSNANSAIQSAKNASIAAASAESSAAAAKESATEAKRTTDEINAYADTAGKTVTQILHDGETAGTAAEQAKTDAASAKVSAENASEYAARALGNLSTVQSVTETLNWITAHGTMTLTTDTELDPTHVYFVADQNGDYVVGGNHYSVVTEPNVDDIATYYELGIDESLNNYVATHLSLMNDGLYVMADNSEWKVKIADDGVYILDPNDTPANQMTGSGNIIGYEDETHAEIDYHSMRLIDKERDEYLYVSDLRDRTGQYEVRQQFTLTSEPFDTKRLYLWANPSENYDIDMYYGTYISSYTKAEFEQYFEISERTYKGDYPNIVISCKDQQVFKYKINFIAVYKTESPLMKGFTFGSRQSGTYPWDRFIGPLSAAIGYKLKATGRYSFATGAYNSVHSTGSFACGDHNEVSGEYAFAEGVMTSAEEHASHSEGSGTTAKGRISHAEGLNTTAEGRWSHSEGSSTSAKGDASHAQNYCTIASKNYQTVIGKWNIEDTETDESKQKAFIIGNGDGDRSNAFTVDWDGNTVASGDITDGNGNVLSNALFEDSNGDLTITRDVIATRNLQGNNALLELDTTATSGTDKEIYDALVSLGWDSDVIV